MYAIAPFTLIPVPVVSFTIIPIIPYGRPTRSVTAARRIHRQRSRQHTASTLTAADVRQYDGVRCVRPPLFVPAEALLTAAMVPPPAPQPEPAQPVQPPTTDGIRCVRPPLFVTPEGRTLISTTPPQPTAAPTQTASEPAPEPIQPPTTDGVLCVRPPLFVTPEGRTLISAQTATPPQPTAAPTQPQPTPPETTDGVLCVRPPLFVSPTAPAPLSPPAEPTTDTDGLLCVRPPLFVPPAARDFFSRPPPQPQPIAEPLPLSVEEQRRRYALSEKERYDRMIIKERIVPPPRPPSPKRNLPVVWAAPNLRKEKESLGHLKATALSVIAALGI